MWFYMENLEIGQKNIFAFFWSNIYWRKRIQLFNYLRGLGIPCLVSL